MRRTPPDPQLRNVLLGSLAAHGLGLLVLVGLSNLSARRAPPPQNVLVTKLVRLGTPRPKELLPQKASAAQPAPPPAPTPKPGDPAPTPTPPAASKTVPAIAISAPPPTAKEQAKARSQLTSALAKIKRNVDGQADGSVDGETDKAQQGDKYGSEIVACIRKNYTIEGVDARRTQGRKATLTLWIQNSGKITNHRITESSGLAAMDQAVSRAVLRCGQVSAPPAALRRDIQKYGVEVIFNP